MPFSTAWGNANFLGRFKGGFARAFRKGKIPAIKLSQIIDKTMVRIGKAIPFRSRIIVLLNPFQSVMLGQDDLLILIQLG